MKISVIIPLYNGEKTILRTLKSVLNQTKTADEIIIVNDGSTDSSSEILKPFIKQEKIKYFFKQNGGVSSARNYGIKISKNEWIAFIDSDDEWDKYFLENIKKYHKKNKLANVICTNYRKSFNGGTPIEMRFKKLALNKYGEITNYLESTISKENPISSSSIVIKKDELVRINYFPENMTQGEDLISWYRLNETNRIGFISKPLATIYFLASQNNRPKRKPDFHDHLTKELLLIRKQNKRNVKMIEKRIRLIKKSRAIGFKNLGYTKHAMKQILFLFKSNNFKCIEVLLFLSFLIPSKYWNILFIKIQNFIKQKFNFLK